MCASAQPVRTEMGAGRSAGDEAGVADLGGALELGAGDLRVAARDERGLHARHRREDVVQVRSGRGVEPAVSPGEVVERVGRRLAREAVARRERLEEGAA